MEKHVVLCSNPHRDIGLKYALQAKRLLRDVGIDSVISAIFNTDKEVGSELPGHVDALPLEEAKIGAGLLVTFGGDGTILHASRAVVGHEVPIIGVNLGTKGFLAELEPEDMDKIVDAARGKYIPDPRMMLDVSLIRGEGIIYRDVALNDIALNGVANIIHVTALGDDRKILEYSGDGIIVATPTGSTAYSMSAGGPLVEPSARNIILTPVCAHALAVRSFVLAPDRTLTILPGDLQGKWAIISVDGGARIELRPGDRIQVKKSDYETHFIHVGEKSFYDRVFEKLGDRT